MSRKRAAPHATGLDLTVAKRDLKDSWGGPMLNPGGRAVAWCGKIFCGRAGFGNSPCFMPPALATQLSTTVA